MPAPILKFFAYEHLPPHLQAVSQPLGELARKMDEELPDGAEKSTGLRKLLEAKDAFVRAALPVVLLLVALVALPACVSSRLAETNLANVTALASAAVAEDPAAMPEAQKAVDTAGALVDATGWLAQVTHLGVPSALVEENVANVRALAAKLPEPTPAQRETIRMGTEAANELAGRSRYSAGVTEAVRSNPWADAALAAVQLVGGGIGVLYGLTRGRRHVSDWWVAPPAGAAAAPTAALPSPSPPAPPSA